MALIADLHRAILQAQQRQLLRRRLPPAAHLEWQAQIHMQQRCMARWTGLQDHVTRVIYKRRAWELLE